MKKGFTLIELLIVIGILAVLSSAVVVVLNPAQLLAQARDTQRISDLGSIHSAIAFYLSATNLTTKLLAPATAGNICSTNYWATVGGVATPFSNGGGIQSGQQGRMVTGGGWVPIDLVTSTASSGGSVLSVLPIDPINTATSFYAYSCAESDVTGIRVFELDTVLESTKYKAKAANAADGGNAVAVDVYEVGTSLTL